jgi:rare lipoprotein A
MRPAVVFCAIGFGIGCDAAAAEQGLASFYGNPLAGDLTAAHRSLPMGTQVRILNLDNGRAVVVKIVDRGPFIRGRIIDVSTAAATTLGFRTAGLAHVKIEPMPAGGSTKGLRLARQAETALIQTSSVEICRYGADRLEYLRSDSAGIVVAVAHNAAGCEDLRSRLFAFAEKTDDLTPFAARGGAFLTEAEAAASIPVSAITAVPEKLPDRHALSMRTGGSVTAHAGFLVTAAEAAASIPVTALAEVPERQTSSTRTNRCGAEKSCERPEPKSAPNPVLLFFARLGDIFD